MYKFKNHVFFMVIALNCISLPAIPFNKNLKEDEKLQVEQGNVVIRNINFYKNISLEKNISETSDYLLQQIKNLDPKYLAEVIQVKPIKGNEDLPEKLTTLLNNVSEYAGIPYFSEKRQRWYDLYSSAEITSKIQNDNKTEIKAKLVMAPFDIVYEDMEIIQTEDTILYTAVNTNKLRYLDKFDCVWPYKMKMCILLLKDDDNWILYGIGGVNAPRIPLFTERIQTSFINRINTFCSFIFSKI